MVFSSSSLLDEPPLPANALLAKPSEHEATNKRAITIDSFFTTVLDLNLRMASICLLQPQNKNGQ